MHVAYRHCAELHHAIALGALLRPLAAGDGEAIGRQIDVYRRKRHETQPREPSAGCIFKNPPGDSAGRLIDASGLKGERVGEPRRSSAVHANFIVKTGGGGGHRGGRAGPDPPGAGPRPAPARASSSSPRKVLLYRGELGGDVL